MSAEQAEALFWKTMADLHDAWPVNKPEVGRQQRLKAWETVIAAIRTNVATETERLRDENRGLRQIVLNALESDAQHAR